MDYYKNATSKIALTIILFFAIAILLAGGSWLIAMSIFTGDANLAYTFWIVIFVPGEMLLALVLAKIISEPLKMLSDVIVYAGHSNRDGQATPDTESLKIGRELVSSLARQVYDLASMSTQSEKLVGGGKDLPTSSSSLLDHIDMPIIGIDEKQNVTVVNRQASKYFEKSAKEAIGKPVYDLASMSFQGEETFEIWLKNSQKNTAINSKVWERVRTDDEKGTAKKQFDLVASFSKENQTGTETILVIYDRTQQYYRDDSEVSFVSLAVHELRTPLTVMKGYIEVFEDELGPTLTPELAGFMHKMKASSQQLTAFVANILNVARVEENQLVLKLQQYKWPEIINYAVADLELRAKVNGKHIEIQTAENLPTVAVDQISIHEVINNLVDNAIKYSGDSEKIIVSSTLNPEGMVEVNIQDFGIGIPQAVMPDLFQKYYRSHKSRVQVGGTGLGLYLSKALVKAHGGNIWVRSKEGKGSTFSFTIQPYDQVKHQKDAGQDGIMRGAHGWIKNHSLNRQ